MSAELVQDAGRPAALRRRRGRPDAAVRRSGLAAAARFLGAWGLLHVGFWRDDQVSTRRSTRRYGELMAHGKVPYRDFTPEYPPLALPAFVLPALVSHDEDGFRQAFEPLMAACGVALLLFVALGARALGDAPERLWATLAYVALFPLALGTVVLTRFDLWPAALTAAALAALLSGRDRLGLGVLALATAAKLYPGVLLPLAVAWAWRRRGRREALVGLGIYLAVLAFCFVPFLALGPDGVVHSFTRQLDRPLQIESLGAGFLLAAHQALGLGITMRSLGGFAEPRGDAAGRARGRCRAPSRSRSRSSGSGGASRAGRWSRRGSRATPPRRSSPSSCWARCSRRSS